ncbi:hypothetical protein J6590_107422, partial [Homalodisca vitripennis]
SVTIPTYLWVRDYHGESPKDPSKEFTVRNPGPRDCPPEHKPVHYFKLFVQDSFISVIVRELTCYAKKEIKKKQRRNRLSSHTRLSSWKN